MNRSVPCVMGVSLAKQDLSVSIAFLLTMRACDIFGHDTSRPASILLKICYACMHACVIDIKYRYMFFKPWICCMVYRISQPSKKVKSLSKSEKSRWKRALTLLFSGA